MGYAWMLSPALAAVLGSCLFNVLVRLVWRPRAIAGGLRRQGVRGPDRKFFVGNLGEIKRLRAAGAGVVLDVGSHDYLPIVQPQFRKWIPLYGRVFLFWYGSTPSLCVAEFNMAKQVLLDRTGQFEKVVIPSFLWLLGKGLLLTNGDEWQRHKKVVHPAFNIDKLKMMTLTMANCARSMVSRWEAQLKNHGKEANQVEIELSSQFEELTADVIAKTAFGSSFKEGRQVFLAISELQSIAASSLFDVQFPGSRYLPTKKNKKAQRLVKLVTSKLMHIIENKLNMKDDAGYGNDLLGLMLDAHEAEHGGADRPLCMDDIVDECRTFFFAGQETTSHLLTWTMFLLSTHPEWQQKLREEVLRVCGKDQLPTYDMLNKLKLVNMFLLETLRLYNPVPMIRRRTTSTADIGGVIVPEGMILGIPIATMHRDKEVWGDDAGEFNPLRFDTTGAGVTTAARHPSDLLSFSMGPRACIGQNFAMTEARAAVAIILRGFVLSLSPKYVHAPINVITLRPKYGIPMILTSIDA